MTTGRAPDRHGPLNWLDILDVKQALVNCHTDILGDWYRDPWGWPELDWVVQDRPDILGTRLNSTGSRRAAKIDVAKEGFSIRPAIVMDPVDRLAFQALVDRSTAAIIGSLRPLVFGWRLGRTDPTSGQYRSNKLEWKDFRQELSTFVGMYECCLTTDVSSFFASVPVERLCEALESRARGRVVARTVDMLRSWATIPGRSGLPQRSMASAALANMYLQPLDDEISRHAPHHALFSPDGTALRWMDDIWVFGDDRGVLRRIQVRLQTAMSELGLTMNSAKTQVLEGEDVARKAREIEHSAVDDGLLLDPPDVRPLEELLEKLHSKPESAPRTSTRFATTRIRHHAMWQHVEAFVESAPRMPQSADHIARLFRDAEVWRDLQAWYVEYSNSPWGCIDWSVAQLGTMFPADEASDGPVTSHLLGLIDQHPRLALVALAAQRCAAWVPNTARAAMREAARSSNDPFERRVFALAGLAAGEERHYVRTLLGEFEENQVTLLMLEATAFRAPATKPDFGGTQ